MLNIVRHRLKPTVSSRKTELFLCFKKLNSDEFALTVQNIYTNLCLEHRIRFTKYTEWPINIESTGSPIYLYFGITYPAQLESKFN